MEDQTKCPLPDFFRPLLWSLRWEDLDVWEDREDIILASFNEGQLKHLRWVIATYGEEELRKVFQRRLSGEFHSESCQLAKIIFPGIKFRDAR